MRAHAIRLVCAVAILVSISMTTGPGGAANGGSPAADAAIQAGNPACTPPTAMASTPEETAWRLWVAATCPANATQVTWETWVEQSTLFPASGAAAAVATPKRFHESPLARARRTRRPGAAAAVTPSECGVATSGRTICEEVRIDPASQAYVKSAGLTTRAGQAKLAASGGPFVFPAPSVEIKADWIQLKSCSNPPQGVRVENVGGTCYALAGMHLSSKLLDKWLWATFEAQNLTTNPQRCVVLGCNDPWGSNPATSKGGASGMTKLTPALAQLMAQAKLSPEWLNYRLDGVQTTYVDAAGKPTILGNSIIEGENAGVPLTSSSCITCHSVSSIKADGTDGVTLLSSDPVGNPAPLPAGFVSRDFAWSLGLACPNGVFRPVGCSP
jgi:hypothetical protein